MVGTDLGKEGAESALELIEVAKTTGKIKKGTNEVTKAVERGVAKMVAIAADVTPQEIVMHLPVLCQEKNIPCIQVTSKEELGAAAGLPIPTTTVAVVSEGEGKALLKDLEEQVKK